MLYSRPLLIISFLYLNISHDNITHLFYRAILFCITNTNPSLFIPLNSALFFFIVFITSCLSNYFIETKYT